MFVFPANHYQICIQFQCLMCAQEYLQIYTITPPNMYIIYIVSFIIFLPHPLKCYMYTKYGKDCLSSSWEKHVNVHDERRRTQTHNSKIQQKKSSIIFSLWFPLQNKEHNILFVYLIFYLINPWLLVISQSLSVSLSLSLSLSLSFV